MKRITKLSPQLANQIAAGEVIERPASLIKELIENSLDAGATSLDIRVEQGGLSRIQVTDNGSGIVKEDLALALHRHATSKLHRSEDLLNISSLGFRGEALASIASVANVTLTSRAEGASSAWEVSYKSASQTLDGPKPSAHATGTTVIVEELFYTVPARKHFLRSARTEFRHIEELVRRLAMAYPKTQLRLNHDKKPILNCPVAEKMSLQGRVMQLLGRAFLQTASPVEASNLGLTLTGYLGAPSNARSHSDQQFLTVNHRIVRDKLLLHAIRQAYQGLVHQGRYPQFVLDLSLGSSGVDVNVHPTKHELRFRQATQVHDFVVSALQKALQFHEQPTESVSVSLTESSPNSLLNQAGIQPEIPRTTKQPLFPVRELTPTPVGTELSAVSIPPLQSQASPLAIKPALRQSVMAAVSQTPLNRLIFPLGDTWLICKETKRLRFIHVHAAMAIQALDSLQQPKAEGEQFNLLLPKTVTLAGDRLSALLNKQAYFASLGFNFSVLNETQVVLHAVPVSLRHADESRLLNTLADLSAPPSEKVCLSKLACYAAPSKLQLLSESERQSLLQWVLAQPEAPVPCCAHGHKAWGSLDEQSLEKALV